MSKLLQYQRRGVKLPKEITLKIKIPTSAEVAEILQIALSQFGELVKVEVTEEKPATETEPSKT